MEISEMLDIFRNNAFTVISLTDAMREIKYVPGRIGALGLFQTSSVRTLSIAIEKDKDQNLFLIQSSARGAPGITFGKNKRNIRDLRLVKYEVNDAVMADEVQNVRAFGEEQAVETLQSVIADRAAETSQSFAVNEEYARLSIIKDGTVLDADGTTVLFNFYTEFGETKPAEIDWDLDNAAPAEGALRKRCAALDRAIAASLDGLPYSGIMALCGDAFFDDLIAHREVRDTYKGFADAAALRLTYTAGGSSAQTGVFAQFEFGGIMWTNYRGSNLVSVGTDKAHFVPMGVPNLFRTIYGPGDYIETVNRPGQRLWAKQWEMPNGKGVNLDFQSNVIHYCTRPRVLFQGRRT
jgi:hypothetical protein